MIYIYMLSVCLVCQINCVGGITVEINNTGVTGQSLPPKNDFEHARGLYALEQLYHGQKRNVHLDMRNLE